MTDYEQELEQEFRFAQQLKDACCDESGKETDPAKAAEIIHEIGRIYRKRSPDKISLIKSAGLMNAAILRNPLNVAQIKLDRFEICQHILHQAKAKNPNADLIKKAEHIKILINQLRTEVKEFLDEYLPAQTANKDFNTLMTNKISAIRKINEIIADKYKHIMADLSQFCQNVMGNPPCEYAIIGMGSLAREEITPYSDFEHIILLFDDKNYKHHLTYFQWYSVIFHVVVLNLQETIIPSLYLVSLNGKDSKLKDWYYDAITPRGVSFDGMMPHACKFPLGRQQHTKKKEFTTELIKPVSEMLEYLSSEADLKNGYHLADILTKTCFVFGNENIFAQFADGAQNYRDQKSIADRINDVEQQVKDDLNCFSTRFRLTELKSQNTINIKRLMYRSTTIFISALANIYNISANSCFDVIDDMEANQKITQNTAQKLRCAIAIACEMRLKVYTRKQSQSDDAIDLKHDGIEKFLNIVGSACTINYFQIAYCLQCEVAKQLNFTKLHFYSDPNLINVTIALAFGMEDLASSSLYAPNRFWQSSNFDFDACITALESRVTFNEMILKDPAYFSVKKDLNSKLIKTIANCLYSAKIFDEAVEFYKQILSIYQKEFEHSNFNCKVAWTNDQIGKCLQRLRKPEEALQYVSHALEIEQKLTTDAETDKTIAWTLHNIGDCYTSLRRFNDSLTYLYQAIEIKQRTTYNVKSDRSVAVTLQHIGYCHKKLQNYSKAFACFNQALEIIKNSTRNAKKDKRIASLLHEIGYCHKDLLNYDVALTHLYQALEIEQNTTRNADKDKSIALKFHTIGVIYFEMHKYKVAWNYLKRELKIRQNITLEADKDKSIAKAFYYIGRCELDLHQYADALTRLNQSLKIRQSIAITAKDSSDIAQTLQCISRCHHELHHYGEASTHLHQALDIEHKLTLEEDDHEDRD